MEIDKLLAAAEQEFSSVQSTIEIVKGKNDDDDFPELLFEGSKSVVISYKDITYEIKKSGKNYRLVEPQIDYNEDLELILEMAIDCILSNAELRKNYPSIRINFQKTPVIKKFYNFSIGNDNTWVLQPKYFMSVHKSMILGLFCTYGNMELFYNHPDSIADVNDALAGNKIAVTYATFKLLKKEAYCLLQQK